MLVNVGLTPEAVTSPGGFGGRTLEFYAKVAGEAVRADCRRGTLGREGMETYAAFAPQAARVAIEV